MNIVQVNSTEAYGGAETIMRTVSSHLESRGNRVDWLVGRLHESEPGGRVHVFRHDQARHLWARAWMRAGEKLWSVVGNSRHGRGVCRFLMNEVGQPLRTMRRNLGHEDFCFPDTLTAVERLSMQPDLIHLHGLHSQYFDLRKLEELSRICPVVITMHDAWLVTGHCAYPGECVGYTRGCGQCPDLKRFPQIKRDATAYNFQRKANIYRRSGLHLVTPSVWLMDLVEASAMKEVFTSRSVIHNGVDAEQFSPGDREVAQQKAGISHFDDVILYCAKNAKTSMYKDFATAHRASRIYADRHPERKVLFQVVGEESGYGVEGNLVVRYVSLKAGSSMMREYYRAADVLVHTSKSENFPTVVLEAMASGIPSILSDTGGMREQIQALQLSGIASCPEITYVSENDSCGGLVREGDVDGVVQYLEKILYHRDLKEQMGQNARKRFEQRYTSEHMGNEYEELYKNLIKTACQQNEKYENK